MKDIFKFNKSAKLLVVPATVAIWCLVAVVLFSGKALALNDGAKGSPPIGWNAPQTSSSNRHDNQSDGQQPWLVVGNGDYDGDIMRVKIYVPVGKSAKLHIYQQGNGTDGQECGGIDYGDIKTTYTLYAADSGELMGPKVGQVKNVTDCNEHTITMGSGSGTVATRILGHEGYRVYILEVSHSGLYGERSFRLRATGLDSDSINNGSLIGMVRNQSFTGVKAFGVTRRDLGTPAFKNSPYWDFGVQLAPRCDDNTSNTSVWIHDADKGQYGQSDMAASIKAADDSGYSWGSALYSIPGDKAWKTNTPGNPHTDNYLNFTPDPQNNSRYIVIFSSFSWKNAIQFGIPYDQFDAQQSVRNSCKHKAACSATASDATPAANAPVTITVKATNTSNPPPPPKINNPY